MAQRRTQAPAAPPFTTFSVRVCAAYSAWLHKLEQFERLKVSEMIDRALADYAVKVGFHEAPPPRF